ncbi:hypothetical protein QCE62_00170 [Caballeronia sp. LZ033]|nr:hypothetical protein [Caballeronia sp. LZ033]MDR5812002.1 hypothetical protein [Caballeronia sp. LZ033]
MSRFLSSLWDHGFWTLMLLTSLAGWLLGGWVAVTLFRLIFGR